ncbi:MAG: hypothetical protein IKP32_02900 [Clostridia bacterium]|nr:hypothetical protein [Clostridia bacterium]
MKMNVRNRIMAWGLALLMLFACLPVHAAPAEKKAIRTLMIYMVGSDLEEYDGHMTYKMNQIKATIKNSDDVHVLIMAGGCDKWHSTILKRGEAGIFEVVRTASGAYLKLAPDTIVSDDVNMGEWLTLCIFLNYCYAYYPAEEFDLILMDHGGGPIGGCLWDHGDGLTLGEITSALKKSPFAKTGSLARENKLGFIGFDACMMGSLELAAAMSPYAHYMLASEDVAWTSTFDYSFVGDAPMTGTCKNLVKHICQIHARNINNPTSQGMVDMLAAYDLDWMPELISDIETLASSLNKKCQSDKHNSLVLGRGMAKAYEMDNWGRHENETDLYDLMDFLKAAEPISEWASGRAQASLEKVIIALSRTKRARRMCGISIYFPMMDRNGIESALEIYQDWVNEHSLMPSYYQFIRSFANRKLRFNNMVYLAGVSDGGHTAAYRPDWMEQTFSIPVPQECGENYARAAYTVLAKEEGDVYRLVEGGRSLTMNENGALEVTLPWKAPVVRGGEDQPWQEYTRIEAYRDEDAIYFNVPAMLIHDLTVRNATALMWADAEHPDGYFDTLREDTGEDYPSPVALTPVPGDLLSFAYLVRRLTLDASGVPLPFYQWYNPEPGTVYFCEAYVSDGGLQFSRQPLDPDTEYFVQLYVIDLEGTTYCTDLMPLGPAR